MGSGAGQWYQLAVEHCSNQRVTTQSVKTETATIMGEPRKGGKASAFNRKPLDRRLVREVIFGARAPKYWTPMAIMEEECKLMRCVSSPTTTSTWTPSSDD